jgi:hypothetical protein
MDADRFDALVRSLSTTGSRRGLTRWLGGLTAGSLLAPLLAVAGAAKPKKCKPKCKGKQCGPDGCKGKCGKCKQNESCTKGGKCKCVPDCTGKPCGAGNGCGGACQSGSCSAGKVCVRGACEGACPDTATLCADECVDTDTDNQHCGLCDRPCTGDLTCIAGTCDCASGVKCGDECVDPLSDNEHCGGCGTRCQGDLTCLSGNCGCASGTQCDSACVDTNSDSAHCGFCDNPCPANTTCKSGQCITSCDPSCRADGSANDQTCPGKPGPCPCQKHCGGGWCGDCCHDGHCIGHQDGNRCIEPDDPDHAGNYVCGCWANEEPCGLNAECSSCCAPQECVDRYGQGWTCKYGSDTPGEVGLGAKGCGCDTENGYGRFGNICCKQGYVECQDNSECCSGTCDQGQTPPFCTW